MKAFENIKREAGIPYFSTLYDIDMWREDLQTVENALHRLEKFETPVNKKDIRSVAERLTALEIIKDSLEDTSLILWKHNVYGKGIVHYCLGTKITKEKYEFLKKILGEKSSKKSSNK